MNYLKKFQSIFFKYVNISTLLVLASEMQTSTDDWNKSNFGEICFVRFMRWNVWADDKYFLPSIKGENRSCRNTLSNSMCRYLQCSHRFIATFIVQKWTVPIICISILMIHDACINMKWILSYVIYSTAFVFLEFSFL